MKNKSGLELLISRSMATKKFRKILSLVMYYLTMLDDVI